MRGVVKWFSSKRGYGFIRCADGHPDVFCYFTAVQTSHHRGRSFLRRGEEVEFEIIRGTRGPQAHNVFRLWSEHED